MLPRLWVPQQEAARCNVAGGQEAGAHRPRCGLPTQGSHFLAVHLDF